MSIKRRFFALERFGADTQSSASSPAGQRSGRRTRPGAARSFGIAVVVVATLMASIGLGASPAAASGTGSASFDGTEPNSMDVNVPQTLVITWQCSINTCNNMVVSITTTGALVGSNTCNLGNVAAGTNGQCTITVEFPGGTPNGATGTVNVSVSVSGGSGFGDSHTITAIAPPPTTTTTTTTGVPNTTTTSPITTTTGPPTTPPTTAPPVPTVDVYLHKDATENDLELGDTFTYTFNIQNTGDFTWNTLELGDNLPPEFSYSNASANTGGVVNLVGNTLTINWTNIPAGNSVFATIDATVVYPGANSVSYALPADIDNCATASVTSADGPDSFLSCEDVEVEHPMDLDKDAASSEVATGDQIAWDLSLENDASGVNIEGAVIVDTIDPKLRLDEIETGTWTPASATGLFEVQIAGAWTTLGTYDGSASTLVAAPAGVEAVRVTFGDLVPSFETGSDIRLITTAIYPDRNGFAYGVPGSVTNCIQGTSTNFGTVSDCDSATIVPAIAVPVPSKSTTVHNSGPTQEAEFIVRMGNNGTANRPLIDPFVTDHLSEHLEFVSWTPITAGPAPTFTMTPDHGVPGRTLLHWDFAGQTFSPGQIYELRLVVRIAPGTPTATYWNFVLGDTNDTTHTVACVGSSTADNFDVDGDGNSVEGLCVAASSYNVIEMLLTAARMLVTGEPDLPFLEELPDGSLIEDVGNCENIGGYTFYPCVAQTRSLGNADYRLELNNLGNVAVNNFVVYNTLPFVGDPFVTQIAAGTPRGSQWRPPLLDELQVIEAPAGASLRIEYSFSTNPCRPEMTVSGDPTPWPDPCDASWVTGPLTAAELEAVQAIRVVVSGSFLGGENIVLGYDMNASHGSPFGDEIAWTSFGYAGNRADTGGRLQPSEPRPTGIVIKSPDNGVGDFVWLDLNRNGLQDDDEPGLNGVEVQLWRYDDITLVPELWLTTHTEYLSGDTTRPGYYFFGDQPEGTYFVQFEAPRIGWNVMFPDMTDSDPATVDDEIDSDGDLETLRTLDFVLLELDIQLQHDQGYFLPGGPFGCDTAEGERTTDERRNENDPRPCPT